MKRVLKIILILIITFVGFLFVNKQIGWFDIPLFSVPSDSVRVKFINESDQTIKAIYINGQTIKMLANGDSYIYTYKHYGEGTYQYTVEFENGKKLREGERYVESGYYNTELIKNNIESELTNFSLANINSMFSNIDFMDTAYTFERGYFVNPKFNKNYIVESDTANFVFLKLFERSDSILMAVNKQLCYTTILPKFRGFYYPNESIIYPYDFRFLNKNKPSLNINCINEDDQDYRLVGFYKGLLGSWIVDSVETERKHYEFDSRLESLEFSKEVVILNDTIKADYLQSGFTLRIEDYPFDFYKIFMNGNKSIFINTYHDSYEVFYLSKSK